MEGVVYGEALNDCDEIAVACSRVTLALFVILATRLFVVATARHAIAER